MKQKEQTLKNNKRQLKELTPKTTEAVGRGKILEKIVPAYSEMKYRLSDYTAIFEPIDYILFDGVSRNGHIESVKFIDCKSGMAGLNRHQKEIKTAVEQERLSFETYKEIRQ